MSKSSYSKLRLEDTYSTSNLNLTNLSTIKKVHELNKSSRLDHYDVYNLLDKNLRLLNQLYPPSQEFRRVLAKDMFTKTNSTAFQETVWYLLEILDSTRLHSKVKSWPIVDVQMAKDFREEVFEYLNELSSEALPPVSKAQLVAPGGYKFANYMCKLSILVMEKVMDGKSEMGPLRASKNPQVTAINVSNMKKGVKLIRKERLKETERFLEIMRGYERELDEFSEELRIKNEEIRDLKDQFKSIQIKLKSNFSEITEIDLSHDLNRIEYLEKLSKKTDELKKHIEFLTNSNLIFISKKENFMDFILEFNNKLDLSSKNMFPTNSNIQKDIEKYVVGNRELEEKVKNTEGVVELFSGFMEQLKAVESEMDKSKVSKDM